MVGHPAIIYINEVAIVPVPEKLLLFRHRSRDYAQRGVGTCMRERWRICRVDYRNWKCVCMVSGQGRCPGRLCHGVSGQGRRPGRLCHGVSSQGRCPGRQLGLGLGFVLAFRVEKQNSSSIEIEIL